MTDPRKLLPIGDRVRSQFTERLTGIVVGYGTVQGQWSPFNQPVYLVALDEALPWDDTDQLTRSVIVINIAHVIAL